jgi:hypothetical protein
MATRIDLGFELPREVHILDEYLRRGYPTLGWRGDPNLYLIMSVITTQKGGYQVDPDGKSRFHRVGDKVGWCWQVMRHCETGEDEPILQAKGTELHRIIPRLIQMDPRTPGFEDVMDKVEREDALVHKHKQQAIAEAEGEAREHLWALVSDRQNGRTTFRGMPGSNPDRQL